MEYYPQLAHPGTLASSWQRTVVGSSAVVDAATVADLGATKMRPSVRMKLHRVAVLVANGAIPRAVWFICCQHLADPGEAPCRMFLLACAATCATTKNFDGMTNTRCMLHAMNDITCGKTKPVQCLWDIICDRICQEAWGVLPTHGQDSFQKKMDILYIIYIYKILYNQYYQNWDIIGTQQLSRKIMGKLYYD